MRLDQVREECRKHEEAVSGERNGKSQKQVSEGWNVELFVLYVLIDPFFGETMNFEPVLNCYFVFKIECSKRLKHVRVECSGRKSFGVV